MNQKQTLTIMSGFLLVSAALIAGLASASITTDRKDKSMMHAQKIDTNDDGAVSLDELTTRQDRQFAKLDRDENGMIEKHEFNPHLVNVFHRMDRNGNGILQNYELPGHRFGDNKHQFSDTASDPSKTC